MAQPEGIPSVFKHTAGPTMVVTSRHPQAETKGNGPFHHENRRGLLPDVPVVTVHKNPHETGSLGFCSPVCHSPVLGTEEGGFSWFLFLRAPSCCF